MKNILLSIHLLFIDSIVHSQFLQPEDQTSSCLQTGLDNIKDFYCGVFDMDSRSELHLEEGIPSEYNEKQTLRAVQKRSQIYSQQEEKYTINDFQKRQQHGKSWKARPEFQGDKQTIVTFVERPNSPQHKDNLGQTNQNVDMP